MVNGNDLGVVHMTGDVVRYLDVGQDCRQAILEGSRVQMILPLTKWLSLAPVIRRKKERPAFASKQRSVHAHSQQRRLLQHHQHVPSSIQLQRYREEEKLCERETFDPLSLVAGPGGHGSCRSHE